MTDNVTANPGAGGATFRTDEIGGVHYPVGKIAFGADDQATSVSASNPLPVTQPGAATETTLASVLAALGDVLAQLQATLSVTAASLPLPTGAATSAKQDSLLTAIGSPLQAGGTVTVANPGLTDSQLRAAAVPVSGTFWQATQPVSGPLTDAQLRASAVPVSGNVSTGGLTDAQLRATAVPVSGTVTANTGLTQPLTDTQLRASAVPVSGTFFQATQPVSASALPLPSGAATSEKQDAIISALGSPLQAGGTVTVANPGLTQYELEKTKLDCFEAQNAEIGNELLSGSGSVDGSENSNTVTLNPNFPISLDPNFVVQIGGKTKAGTLIPNVVDDLGASVLSDAPIQYQGMAFNAGSASILCSLDTRGYQSVSLQIYGTWAGTISFYESNDGANWVAVGGWASATAQTMATTTTANGLWVFPAVGRYFKAQITAYTSGTALAAAWLRNQPMSILASTPSQNIAQIAATAAVTAGVNGLLAVGGNIAPGTAATAYPLPVGSVDPSGKTRRILSDINGNIYMTGALPDQSAQPVFITPKSSSSAEDGLADAMNQVLRELRYLGFAVSQLPFHLNTGLSRMDEPQSFRDDPTLNLS